MQDTLFLPIWEALSYLFIWELFVLALEKAGILQKSK